MAARSSTVAPPRQPTNTRRMRLLAFGDSLTAGYHDQGHAFSPWAPVLCRLLGATTVDHIGMSGLTTGQMVRSMEKPVVTDVVPRSWPGLRHQLRSEPPYDVVLIMAGTNDLADQEPTATLVGNLATLHEAAHAAGARTVALNIPESKAAKHVGWLGRARDEANAAIRAWAEGHEWCAFVDAAALVPYSETAQPRLWEFDGLHMTAEGYAAFGRGLAPLIRGFVWPGADGADAQPAAADGGAWRVGAAVRIHGLTKQR